ncbi:antitoxin [Streptomyces sp. Ru73]|uniref:antitoxin n=1 Tax=Streptomyces sp. Ru73 TaxID=2080748 RepID=UPI000CDDCC48|nr:antitoxin [Streptomyces sp. Ru73]POX39152.1 antitoxin [Streptomyces sp. Ru73]
MGLLDNLKAKAGLLKGKAGDLALQHGDKIERGLDKAGRTADARTKGKYSGQIGTGTTKAKEALRRMAEGQEKHTPGAGGRSAGEHGTGRRPGDPM